VISLPRSLLFIFFDIVSGVTHVCWVYYNILTGSSLFFALHNPVVVDRQQIHHVYAACILLRQFATIICCFSAAQPTLKFKKAMIAYVIKQFFEQNHVHPKIHTNYIKYGSPYYSCCETFSIASPILWNFLCIIRKSVLSDTKTLSASSGLSVRVPRCQKLQMTALPGLAQDAFYPYGNSGRQRVNTNR